MATLRGIESWSSSRTDDGDTTYEVVNRVAAAVGDGPAAISECPGLPTPGSVWQPPDSTDLDEWAFCTWYMKVEQVAKKERELDFLVTQRFTTKPPDTKRCRDARVTDPILEPQRISGDFVKYTKEAVKDRFGNPILTSSHEIIRGPQVERDFNRPTVRIQQNVAVLGLDTFTWMIDTLNDSPLWGLPARCIKLSKAPWERNFYGNCYVYYTRTFEFDISVVKNASGTFESGWDRDMLDEGTKALHGHYNATTGHYILDNIGGLPPNPSNPTHFDRYRDRYGNITRVVLDGFGLPAGAPIGTGTGTGGVNGPGTLHYELYDQSNFLVLGIPTIF